MAGLLLKELKIRGLVKRTLIVAPANLTFQWQRDEAPRVCRRAVSVSYPPNNTLGDIAGSIWRPVHRVIGLPITSARRRAAARPPPPRTEDGR